MTVSSDISLIEYLKKYFGFDSFKGNQEVIIKSVLAGKDSFVLMPTGGGKSMCYQLPSLIMDGTAIAYKPVSKNTIPTIHSKTNNHELR